jgi:hypothetical protein
VYIEPYAKSLAGELYSDSIQLDTSADPTKIPFIPFLGVSPRNYSSLFQMSNRKSTNGNLRDWDATTAQPRVSGSFWSYIEYEKEDLKFLGDAIESERAKLKRIQGENRRRRKK